MDHGREHTRAAGGGATRARRWSSPNDGFVRGFWTEDVDDSAVSLTFIVFETLEQARAFREAVLANAPTQAETGVARAGLRIVKVTADA